MPTPELLLVSLPLVFVTIRAEREEVTGEFSGLGRMLGGESARLDEA